MDPGNVLLELHVPDVCRRREGLASSLVRGLPGPGERGEDRLRAVADQRHDRDACFHQSAGQQAALPEEVAATFVYAEDTRALVGATIHRDQPWGPCNVFRYYAGVNANGCQATTACAFCGEMATCP